MMMMVGGAAAAAGAGFVWLVFQDGPDANRHNRRIDAAITRLRGNTADCGTDVGYRDPTW
jgi:hypothetical protein